MRSPGLGSEVVIPGLDEQEQVLLDQTLDLREIPGGESEVPSQSDRSEPELAGRVVAIHVDVRWLVRLMTKKYTRYGPDRSTVGMWRPSAAGARGRERDQIEVVVGEVLVAAGRERLEARMVR